MTIVIFLLSLYYCFLFLYLISLIVVFYKKEEKIIVNSSTPFVSILIAARNEASNIGSCLTAISELDYPSESFEVLIGNDSSEDETRSIVERFILGKSQYKLIEVTGNLGLARGKANVLAHLANEAKGEFLFITDADVEVSTTWIKGLLAYWEEGVGIVSGTTLMKEETLWAKLQNIEWAQAFGMIYIASKQNIPVTAVGNNMMISKKAYQATGGYENIEFSLTEDWKLFNETLALKFKSKNLLDAPSIAYTKPISGIKKLLEQRKRWMHGAIRLPLKLVLILSVQAIFLPIVISTILLFPAVGIAMWAMKLGLNYYFINIVMKRLKQFQQTSSYLIQFELYTAIVSILSLLYYLVPGKTEWKGRRY
ncbi:MAG TPA: glycosyltransferase [Cytophagaceae bacterium]|jgi:cellulose synthase/poly-beta-1,6-N-acetylglucosamine synthase-like glycosyltransferase